MNEIVKIKNEIYNAIESKINEHNTYLQNLISNKCYIDKSEEWQKYDEINGMLKLVKELNLLDKNLIEKLENLNERNNQTILNNE